VSSSHSFSTFFGQGGSVVSFGITPSRFWFSKMRSRTLFQPSSNSFIWLILSTHSLVGWCGACVAPGAYLMKIGLLGSIWCIRVIQSMASSAIAVIRFHVPGGLPWNG
jgi:hypothetical protein